MLYYLHTQTHNKYKDRTQTVLLTKPPNQRTNTCLTFRNMIIFCPKRNITVHACICVTWLLLVQCMYLFLILFIYLFYLFLYFKIQVLVIRVFARTMVDAC